MMGSSGVRKRVATSGEGLNCLGAEGLRRVSQIPERAHACFFISFCLHHCDPCATRGSKTGTQKANCRGLVESPNWCADCMLNEARRSPRKHGKCRVPRGTEPPAPATFTLALAVGGGDPCLHAQEQAHSPGSTP